MISRVWRGWTTAENADAYQHLLLTSILPGIRARGTAGYLGMRVDRRDTPGTTGEVEFVTTMLFDSIDAVIAFAGEQYAVAVVPPSARTLLSRFDAESAHYEVIGGHGGPERAAIPLTE
jgi:hypothetical protein